MKKTLCLILLSIFLFGNNGAKINVAEAETSKSDSANLYKFEIPLPHFKFKDKDSVINWEGTYKENGVDSISFADKVKNIGFKVNRKKRVFGGNKSKEDIEYFATEKDQVLDIPYKTINLSTKYGQVEGIHIELNYKKDPINDMQFITSIIGPKPVIQKCILHKKENLLYQNLTKNGEVLALYVPSGSKAVTLNILPPNEGLWHLKKANNDKEIKSNLVTLIQFLSDTYGDCTPI